MAIEPSTPVSNTEHGSPAANPETTSRILSRSDITVGDQRATVLVINGWTTAQEDTDVRRALPPRGTTPDKATPPFSKLTCRTLDTATNLGELAMLPDGAYVALADGTAARVRFDLNQPGVCLLGAHFLVHGDSILKYLPAVVMHKQSDGEKRVRALHRRVRYGSRWLIANAPWVPEFVCSACLSENSGCVEYPCPTIIALDGES